MKTYSAKQHKVNNIGGEKLGIQPFESNARLCSNFFLSIIVIDPYFPYNFKKFSIALFIWSTNDIYLLAFPSFMKLRSLDFTENAEMQIWSASGVTNNWTFHYSIYFRTDASWLFIWFWHFKWINIIRRCDFVFDLNLAFCSTVSVSAVKCEWMHDFS